MLYSCFLFFQKPIFFKKEKLSVKILVALHGFYLHCNISDVDINSQKVFKEVCYVFVVISSLIELNCRVVRSNS